jgi:hypothetical protein
MKISLDYVEIVDLITYNRIGTLKNIIFYLKLSERT